MGATFQSVADETIGRFLDGLDRRVASLGEKHARELFREYSEEQQPWVTRLLKSIEEEFGTQCDFPSECIFYLYALHRYYVEEQHMSPETIEKEVLLDALRTVETQSAAPASGDMSEEIFSCQRYHFLQHEISGAFFQNWKKYLESLVDEGILCEDAWPYLIEFYLAVLKAYGDQFPSAKIQEPSH